MALYGVDLSRSTIDPGKWKDILGQARLDGNPISFAVFEATVGNCPIPQFPKNWRGARDTPLVCGAYHFYVATQDPVAQAQKYISTVGKLGRGALPPVLDIEYSPSHGVTESYYRKNHARVVSDLKTWIDKVCSHFGVGSPIIYTGAYVWEALGNPSGFSTYPLWLAAYVSAAQLKVPAGWLAWDFWQYKGTTSIKHFPGYVDLNQYRGTETQLQILARMR